MVEEVDIEEGEKLEEITSMEEKVLKINLIEEVINQEVEKKYKF